METLDIEPLVASFVADRAARRNPRSTTAVREAGGGLYHLKHAEHSLAAEASVLEEAGRVEGVPEVRAVEFVGFDGPRNVVVTGHAAGESLFNRVWNATSVLAVGRRGEPVGPETFERLARWLAAFHRRSVGGIHPQARRRAEEWLLRSFESKLRRIAEEAAPPIDSRLAAALRARVERDLGGGAFAAEPVRRLHGDYCLVNLLLTADGTVRVLDFGDTREGFGLEDVARLWTSVWELARRGARRRRALAPALPRLLAAYGLPEDAAESPAFRLLRLWNAVSKAGESVVAGRSYGLSTRWIHRRLVRAHLAWLRGEIGRG